ncbi:PLP-dependent aminotransferase family protein [Tatumella saanichensis]|uniref:MocR-like pyridoxine biosynthesis transcription factor PdxR n=1 Tax=Tatumella saanichensis TaxID=480813 RepID=UPI0004A2A011|nr:PLP-dependent aminotransferase family protein [Tatumella saanichensis]
MRTLYADHLLERLQFDSHGKLHQRLLRALQQAIIDGVFPPETRLPSTRDLAKELGVSRNTVLNAYDSLLAEGYVTSRTGSGTRVAKTLPEFCLNSALPDGLTAGEQQLPPSLSSRGAALLGYATASPFQWGAFVAGAPDVTAFPHKTLSKIQAKLSQQPDPVQLIYSNEGGCRYLRQALAEYLRVARSIRADADQIIITEGIHQAVDLVSRVLCDQSDPVWIEEPGYWGTRNLLRMNGLDVHAVPVDDQGIIPEISARRPAPKLVFVTPSHQYPLGGHLSLSRRQTLLAMARRHRFWIVEDDYDSEFRFSGSPYPSLQGLEEDAPVLYMGTFSKTLYPALRIGYLVVPKNLQAPLRTAAAELYRGGHLLMQRTVSEFISQGHYAAHIRRMRLLYNQRRKFLLGLIQRYLGEAFMPPYQHDAGLHLVMTLPDKSDDVAIARDALRKGVSVRPLSQYYMHRQKKRGLLLGYACVDEKQIFTAFNLLRQCLINAGLCRLRPANGSDS